MTLLDPRLCKGKLTASIASSLGQTMNSKYQVKRPALSKKTFNSHSELALFAGHDSHCH